MTRVAIVAIEDLPSVGAPDDAVRVSEMTVSPPVAYWRSDPRLSELGRGARDAGYETVARKRYLVLDRATVEGELVARPQYTRLEDDEAVDLASCDVIVVALSSGGTGLADCVLPTRPWVAVIERGARDPEAAQASVQSRADAYLTSAYGLADAVAWVASEDRVARPVGQPRLTVIGSSGGDFGNTRLLTAASTTIGRAMTFAEHPQRPDRMPTPTGTIARHHAQIRCVDGVVSVRDLRSTNGTLVIRHGEPARLLCPQEQGGTGRQFGPAASSWILRDPSGDWVELRIGDHLQMEGFWRFRIDGDLAWRADD